ncbi:MAG: 5-(carboxyamino)imidazole ribonucleotide mutase [bacterium]|jgi:5-(carboxyamino)imidazole ribonucleotide mutase|nr:5-(carboxyamino)imidazole ribonucleotide mutase [Bacillota bacterium]HHW54556.1 5-(carboxyamino)imidazole ribonucleotide mutase [Bacillota bacterium]
MAGKVRVGIVMGSDSDLPVMQEAAAVLAELGVGYEMQILSAHRVPEDTAIYAREAAGRGLQVIIAGAGLAAHLPGVIAAYTTLPVIGVPLQAGALGGLDALYAIVQMPPGVPVATVGIGGARNAGILAAQILAVADEGLREKLMVFKEKMAARVRERNARLQENQGKGK